jgi:capsule biosynthesis phosphatase
MKRLIMDLDGTICELIDGDYINAKPNTLVVDKIKEYKKIGFEIVINTSRNVRSLNSNIGKMNITTLPIIIEWLNFNNIPYDEIYLGKPWCGYDGFYVDDKAIRPAEFIKMTKDEIFELLDK